MKIVLVGGGTGGSVTPLLALFQELKNKEENNFLFIGGKSSLEKDFAEENNLSFQAITTGKLRRYFDFQNLFSPILSIIGFFQSLKILLKFRPQIIVAAGSFVAVPVVWAGWLLRIPSLIHQLDIKKGLANALMTPFVKKITITFSPSLKNFPRKKVVLTGNPVRYAVLQGDKDTGYQIFNLKSNLPVLLILGGGTGALPINKIVTRALNQLVSFCQIIHIAGKGKNIFQNESLKDIHRPYSLDSVIEDQKENLLESKSLEYYHVYEFLSQEELKQAYQVADIVVSRAGISTLSEIAVLGKPLIIIPLPDSHQKLNAQYFEKEQAALILDQKVLTPELFTSFIHNLLQNTTKQKELSENIKKLMNPEAAPKIIREIYQICQKDES